ncbi:hypothetical protein COU60_03385 [Candidatus Pacearchaeota archaeon CG10_big_fil_rev_8_21_14_0_10_34_76]|nr:MAG: hypothetical protein COU60_03385 [Candidatus Pacearchaeota archaeon CG10_big_fil_rev_8_21_14_0_10_34_76]
MNKEGRVTFAAVLLSIGIGLVGAGIFSTVVAPIIFEKIINVEGENVGAGLDEGCTLIQAYWALNDKIVSEAQEKRNVNLVVQGENCTGEVTFEVYSLDGKIIRKIGMNGFLNGISIGLWNGEAGSYYFVAGTKNNSVQSNVIEIVEKSSEACNDGLDNDGDGWIDMDDPGCGYIRDVDENNSPRAYQCSDGLDNDGDGLIDGFDPDCSSWGDDSESSLRGTQCSDGLDNDGDGLIDMDDPDCESELDNDESGGFNVVLEYTDSFPRIGHPILFNFEKAYDSVEIKIGDKSYSRQNTDYIYYTPLKTGVNVFEVNVFENGKKITDTINLDVVPQNTNYIKKMKESERPMIPLWNSEVGIQFEQLKDYHFCRMVFSGRPNAYGNDRYFDIYSKDAINTPMADIVIQDLYENYNAGQDVCFFMFKFPHPWQSNPSDYNSSVNGEYDSSNGFEENNWESPFATEGPAQTSAWVERELSRIDNGAPNGFKIDHFILDWESYGGRHFIKYGDGWTCKYQWFGIYSPAVCSFDNNTADSGDDATNVPVLIEQATDSDPRFVQAKINRGVTFDFSAWSNNADYSKRYNITRILNGEWDRMTRDMFFIPTKNHYSDVIFSQYNYALYPKEDPFYNNRGLAIPPNVEENAANAFSPALYFCNQELNMLSVKEIMVLEINTVKIIQRNNYFRSHQIIPWVKPANAIRYQDCPGTNVNFPEFTDQQIWESHLHFLMSGAESFIAWNAGDDEPSNIESMYPIQNAFVSFINLVPEGAVPTETESISKGDSAWISARRSGGNTYVLVSFWDTDSVEYEGVTLKRPEGESFGIYVISS